MHVSFHNMSARVTWIFVLVRTYRLTGFLLCRFGYSLMQELIRHTGALCDTCGGLAANLHDLRKHAMQAHGREICKLCVKSGRFFGQELALRGQQAHQVLEPVSRALCRTECSSDGGLRLFASRIARLPLITECMALTAASIATDSCIEMLRKSPKQLW